MYGMGCPTQIQFLGGCLLMRRGRVAQVLTAHKGDIDHRLHGFLHWKLASIMSLCRSWCSLLLFKITCPLRVV